MGLIHTASHCLVAVVDRLLLPCHLHFRVEFGRRSSGSLIRSVPIWLVTAILRLVTLLLVVLLITVVALRSVCSTVPGVLTEALVQVE